MASTGTCAMHKPKMPALLLHVLVHHIRAMPCKCKTATQMANPHDTSPHLVLKGEDKRNVGTEASKLLCTSCRLTRRSLCTSPPLPAQQDFDMMHIGQLRTLWAAHVPSSKAFAWPEHTVPGFPLEGGVWAEDGRYFFHLFTAHHPVWEFSTSSNLAWESSAPTAIGMSILSVLKFNGFLLGSHLANWSRSGLDMTALPSPNVLFLLTETTGWVSLCLLQSLHWPFASCRLSLPQHPPSPAYGCPC